MGLRSGAWGLKLTRLLPLLNTSHNKSLYTADTVLGETLSILVFFIYQTPLRPLVNSFKICFRFRRNIQLHCLKIRLCFLWWVGMVRIEKVGTTNFFSGVRETGSRKLLLVSQCFPSFLNKFNFFSQDFGILW